MRRPDIENRSRPLLLFRKGGKRSCDIEFIENTCVTTEKKQIMNYEESEFGEPACFFDPYLEFGLVNASAEIRPILKVSRTKPERHTGS